MTQNWSAPDDWYGMNQNKIATLFNTIYAKTAPLKCDTDKDGIPNRLDKDQCETYATQGFSPNGDGKNDSFTIANLPENSCFDKFEYIQVFNRWGQQVYQSYDRKFEWFADEIVSGDYYYLLKFTRQNFKGWISVLK